MKMSQTVTPEMLKSGIKTCLKTGLVPNIAGSPGVGKSSIVKKIAQEAKLKLIDIRLSTFTPEDLNGFPMRHGNKVSFTPFDIFPLENDEVIEGTNGWLIFLDELSSASKPVQAAAYRLILDRQVGNNNLHEKVYLVAAGNKITDNAVVYPMSTALQSRLIHFELDVSVENWINWAISEKFDSRVIAYINYQNQHLMNFKPDHDDNTYPCPRTWEFVNRLLKHVEPKEANLHLFAGTIGWGAATNFITFCKVYQHLPSMSDITNNPETTIVPHEMSTKYATITMLMNKLTDNTAENIIKYVERFPSEMQIVFMRGVNSYDREMARNNSFFLTFLKKFSRINNSV